ncbi:restriction endonuclease subunit S [Candidatus Spongiihabitans sp.]|uniref:restriction endonuclease subunit S n=1 Tax=Candidatus Spongiihabitans sp. TaxID=3101308 RepID=UPI003C6EC472
MSETIQLLDAVCYSKEKVLLESLTLDNYVTTDNFIQNKLGRTRAVNLPPGGGKFTAYKKQDILVANIRPYLKKIWFSDRDGGSSPDVLVFKTKEEHDSKFIYYAMFRDDFFAHMMNGSKGTKMPRGDKNQIMNFTVPLFEKPKQQKIAAMLSALDTKIELNNRINAELEAMAKTLYDYWFVQFDFPDKNDKPYKSSGGKMVYNDILKRPIPEGWKATFLNQILVFERGIEPGSDQYFLTKESNKHIPFFKVGSMNNNPSNWILSEVAGSSVCKKGDVMVSFDGTIGKISISLDGSYSSGIRKIYPKENIGITSSFVYQILQTAEIQKTIKKYATGSIILHASESIKYLKIPYCPKTIKKFAYFRDKIYHKQLTIIKENQKLVALRDWLLPMLMNGQITVK